MASPTFDQAFDHSPVGMAFLSGEGVVLSANPALLAMVGKSRDQVEGVALAAHFSSEGVASWGGFFESFLRGAGTQEGLELATLTAAGEAWWNLRLTALGDQPQDGYFAVVQDVTVRRAAEQKLREARLLAEGASRAKSEFLANMSHEIRTPLFTITGMTDLLRLGDLKRDQAHHAGQIASAAQHLLDLVNDVLDFSKIEAGQMSLESIPLDLDDVVGRSLEVVTLTAYRKGIELVLDLDPSVPRRWLADPSRLRQVLVNLLGNAVKFTHQGRVTLVVEPGPTFRVRDTGIGISEEARRSLFHVFTQADSSTTRRYGGTGLGLAISQRLVGLLGGKIDLTSVPGEGTEFFFTLNLPLDGPPGAPPAPPGHGRSVLLVDDDPGVREVLGRRLTEQGFAVRTVASRAEAHDAIRARRPDVVVIDQELGPEDGWQLASEVRGDADTQTIPLVLMSLLRKTLEPSPRYPADLFRAFVDKPVNTRTLGQLLAAGLEGRWTAATETSSTGLLGRALKAKSPERLKILVAEDHEVNRELFRLLLRTLGHEVVLVEDGREACDVAGEVKPQLIFMDLQMPKMNGYEATKELRARGLTCPIVAVTASALKGELERCQAAGMDGILTKPFNLDTLDGVVKSYVPRALGAAATPVVDPGPQAPPRGAEEAFSLDEAARVFLGNRELLFKVIEKFLVQTRGLLEALDRGAQAGDAAALRASAHALKGSSANLTARPLAQAAQALELAAADHDIANARDLIATIRHKFSAFEQTVRPLLEKAPG